MLLFIYLILFKKKKLELSFLEFYAITKIIVKSH